MFGLSAYSFVIPALGARIHALGAAPEKGVDPGTKSRDDGVKYGESIAIGINAPWR